MNFSASGGSGNPAGAGRNRAAFQSPELRNRSSGGFGAAAGMTDLAGVFQANRARAPRVDKMGANHIQNRASERANVALAEAKTHATGIAALGRYKSSEIIGDATVKGAEAKREGAKSGALMSGVGSILGAGIGLLGSDRTMKDNINEIDDALEKLRALKPVTFHYKEEFSGWPERMHHGFIAQEFEEVLPDATYYDESLSKMCIDTADVIGLLVRGIQQLEARVMYLEAQRALAGVK